jgi:hypothetical protein
MGGCRATQSCWLRESIAPFEERPANSVVAAFHRNGRAVDPGRCGRKSGKGSTSGQQPHDRIYDVTMELQPVAHDLPWELVQWFSVEVDQGDAPELHLAGLEADGLVRCFAVLHAHADKWSARTFHIDAEGIDVTVVDRPEVAELVVSRQVGVACVGTDELDVDGVRLPLVEMFLYPSEIQFFWWPSAQWKAERITAFLGLLVELLDLAPGSELRPDPRYLAPARSALGRALASYIGRPSQVSPRG